METFLGVIGSNAINRYGFQFTVGALTRMVYDACLGGMPLLVSHDASRQVGWSWPLAVHLAPNLARLITLNGITTDEESRQENLARYNNHLYETGIKEFGTEIQELRIKLSAYLQGNEKAFVVECATLTEPGLAVRVFPELFSKQDKDGLISLQDLSPIGSGVFQIGELTVFAHLYFRRGLYLLDFR